MTKGKRSEEKNENTTSSSTFKSILETSQGGNFFLKEKKNLITGICCFLGIEW